MESFVDYVHEEAKESYETVAQFPFLKRVLPSDQYCVHSIC